MTQHQQYDDYSDIDQWQEGYQPQQAMPAGPEILPPGTYDLEIDQGELARLQGDRPEVIFRLHLSVLSGPYKGTHFVKPYFFRRQESLNFLGGDLMTLGLDADQWGHRGRNWSEELRGALPKLRSIRFSGQVTEFTKNDGSKGADLRIRARLSGRPMPASSQPAPTRPQPAQQPAFNSYAGQESEIPF